MGEESIVIWVIAGLLGAVAAFIAIYAISNLSPYYDFGDGLGKLLGKLSKDEPKTPKELKPLIKPQTNRDFTIEMLKLRKKTLKEIGYDPMCPVNATEEERIAADKLAATLEYLVNEYTDPDEFDKALTKFNNNKENSK